MEDLYVELRYNDGENSKKFQIDDVKVTETAEEEETPTEPTPEVPEETPTPEPEKDEGCGSVLGGVYSVIALMTVGGACALVRRGKRDW